MTTLAKLIGDRMALPGAELSLDQVVARAIKAGEKLGRSNVHNLANEVPKAMSRSTLFGLAAGLGISPLMVGYAVLESWGLNPQGYEVTDTAETVRIDPTLSDRDREQLLALIGVMRGEHTAVPDEAQQGASGEEVEGEKNRRKLRALSSEDQEPKVDRSAEWGKPQPLPEDVEGEIAAGRMAASRRNKPADLEPADDQSLHDAEEGFNAAARAAAQRLRDAGKGDVEA